MRHFNKTEKLQWQQASAINWKSTAGGYSIMLLQPNMYRTERYRAYRHGKFLGEHVTIDDAKLQCDAIEGNIT